MSGNVEVLVGRMADLDKVETAQGIREVRDVQDRAKWSWLRLHLGRSIDDEIKQTVEARKAELGLKVSSVVLDDMVTRLIRSDAQQRELQYIVVDDIVKGVATTRHLLIPPEQVLDAAEEIADRQGLVLTEQEGLAGLVSTEKETAGIQIGYHLYPGDILTRKAISVSSFARTVVCTNPLTWAGIGNFQRFGIDKTHERVLRIEKITELRPRLERAIEGSREILSKLEALINRARSTKVDDREAKAILTAFGTAYGIGLKPIGEVIERLTVEPKSTYGMAQAASWVARHGERWKKPTEGEIPHAKQSMATVGAASLLIDDVQVTYARALEWLRGKFPDKQPEWLTP